MKAYRSVPILYFLVFLLLPIFHLIIMVKSSFINAFASQKIIYFHSIIYTCWQALLSTIVTLTAALIGAYFLRGKLSIISKIQLTILLLSFFLPIISIGQVISVTKNQYFYRWVIPQNHPLILKIGRAHV